MDPDMKTASGVDPLRRERMRRRARLAAVASRWIPPAASLLLALLYLAAAIRHGFDLGIGLSVIVSNATPVALLATGATFIFTCGSFDLSLGSNMLVSALLAALAAEAGGGVVVIVLVAVGCAVLLSTLNASLATVFHLPVFIMTVVMMNVYSTVATLILTTLGTNAALAVPPALVSGLNNTAFRLLLLLFYEVLACVIFYLMRTGRRQRFLGGNPLCAVLSGIRPGAVTVGAFALAGIGIGLAAFSMIVETPTLSASSGASVGMNMLIALVFGGMRMNGGPGSRMYAALLGAFSMAFLDAFMNIFVTGSWYLQIVKGILFVLVVFLFSVGNRGRLLER